MGKINFVLGVLFISFALLANAAEHSLENASVGNESNSSTFTTIEISANEQVSAASSDNGTVTSIVISEGSQPSESAEISANIEEQSQTTEEKTGKAVTASFGVYLQIVG